MRHHVVAILVVAAFSLVLMVAPSYAAMLEIQAPSGAVYCYDQYGNLLPCGSGVVIATSVEDGSQTTAYVNDGRFIMWLAPGTYEVTASAEGYIPETLMVTVGPGSVVYPQFELKQSNEPIPEYPPSIQPLMLVVAALAAVIMIRRRRRILSEAS